jgi:2-oxoglutarate dehydrogenase E2 component (dihydrolipoamide succinyltransferase)
MAITVELPALGESVLEGTVARWLVKEGDRVAMDQPLVEVTTDKVDAEIPSPATGVVQQIMVSEGQTVEIGSELARIDPSLEAAARGQQSAPIEEPLSTQEPFPDAPVATPIARRLAEEARVDLTDVRGTGSAGRITKSDVLDHGATPAARQPLALPDREATVQPCQPTQTAAVARVSVAPAPSTNSTAPPERVPAYMQYQLQPGDHVVQMTPQRRLIAEHMVYSKHTSPHVGTVAELDMTDVVRLRAGKKGAFEESNGFGLTFLPFIVQATVRALREFPALNASVVEGAIVEKRDINIGLAVETEKGLVAPVLRNADHLSLVGVAQAIDDLSSRARSKRLSADELRGGSFTISNPGRRGNLYGFAIINQPQVGILRIGEIVKRPIVRTVDGEDTIAIRSMMHLALSYDHRAVDGQPANGFLYRVREQLEAAEFDL